jgi:PAS domain S-box-containing protein
MSRKSPAKEKFKASLEGTPKTIKPPSQKILYLVLALVTVFLLVGGYLFYHFQEQQMRQRIEEGLSIVAKLKADQIAQWRTERLVDANIIMGSPFLIDGMVKYMASPADTGLRDEVLASLASTGKSYPYQNILLVDVNGNVLLNLNENVNLLGDETLAQLAVAFKEHKAVMTDFHYPPNRDSPHLDVIAPLFPWHQDSEPIGAVVLCIDPSEYLWLLVQTSPVQSETAETFLVERDGDQVLFLNELRHQKDTALKLRIPLSRQEVPAVMAVLGKEGVVEGKDYRGVATLAALKHIPDSPWYMVTKIDTSEALSAWLFQAGIIVLFVAGLLAFSLAATGFVWQRRQKRVYQALYQAEIDNKALRRHFEYLVRYANDIIVLSDENQHIVEVNDRALETYGYTFEEMLGLPVAALIPPGGFSSYRERMHKIRKEGTFVAEAIHQRKDGSTFPVEVSARLIKIEDKQYIQAITRDITERKKTEEEKSTILATMSELVIYQDLEHRVVLANRAAGESVGLAPEDLVGRYCYEIWHRRSLPCENCPVAKAWETGKLQENEMSSPDGKYWLVRGYPVPGPDGAFSGAIEVTQDITERRRVETEMKAGEARYKELADSITDVFFAMDRDLRYTYWNKASEKLTGIAAEEALGKHLSDIFPDTEETKAAERVYLEVLGTGKPRNFVNEYPLNGKKNWFEISAYPTETGISVFVRDITERKKAEMEYQTIVGTAMDGFAIHDMQGHFLDVNEAYCQLVGYSRDELLDMLFEDVEVIEQPQDRAERIRKIVKETGYDRFEDRLRRKDGGTVDIDISVNYLPTDGGRFFVFLRDITERKRMEEVLAEEATRRRILMDQSRDGISILDENSKLVEANRRFAEMLGYTSEELRDFHSWDWDAQWTRDELFEMGRNVDEAGVHLETRHHRKDGTVFDVELSVNRVVVAGKTLLFCVSRDITERRQAEEALKESEAKHRILFETMAQGVVYQNTEGLITSVNSAAERILGLTLDQMIGRTSMDPHWKAIHEDGSDFPGDTHPSMLALKTGKPIMNVVMGVFNPGLNKHVWININAIPHFRNGGSKPYQVYTTFEDITERKQAEEALRRSEQNFRDSMEKSPLGIRILDKYGKKSVYFNRALLDMWGYSSIEELESVPREQRYTPESYAEQVERLEKRRRGEPAPLDYEVSIVRGDGQIRYLSVSRGELRWGGEKVFQLLYQDVTERKLVEEALRDSEERYRLLIELSPEAIFVASEGKHVFANNAGLKLLGASSPDQIIGKSVKDVIHPDYREIAAERMRKAIETGIAAPVLEEKFVRLDGTVIDVEVRGAPLLYQGKKAIQVFVTDVTERKRADEALRLSEQNLRNSIENSPFGIWIADKDGEAIYANRALLDMWGYSSVEEMEAVPRKQRFTPDSYDEHRTRVDKRKRGESTPSNYELSIVRSDGQVRTLSVSSGELLWGGKKVFQLVYQDITELKLAAEELEKAVEELQRSNAELERFAYVASHDLQEPLRMVSSYTQLLERRYKDKLDADANDFINYAVGGVNRMQELLNDLLVYSRVGTRAKPFKSTDMEAVLEAALANLHVAIKESKTKVSHDPLPTVMADGGQMVQVLQNLIGNAIKFHGEKSPRIHVSAERRDSEWVFSVKDNGIGIEPQYFERIFLIFQRLHRDEYPGTGTGLAIVKRIVERHGGQIWIESEPGKGSTFYFSVKAVGMRQQAKGVRQKATKSPLGTSDE